LATALAVRERKGTVSKNVGTTFVLFFGNLLHHEFNNFLFSGVEVPDLRSNTHCTGYR